MKKIIRLTENDLAKIIKKVISETEENFPGFGMKIKSIFVDRKPDGTLGDKTTVTLNNGKIIPNNQISEISAECKSGDFNNLNENCRVGISTNKFDWMCSKSGCNKMN